MGIHRYWEGPASPMEPWLARVIEATHPAKLLRDWTEAEVADISVDDSQVRAEDVVRHRSNVIRYTLLFRHGGIWLDNDVIPLVDVTSCRPDGPWTAALGKQREGSVLCFPAGHRFLGKALALIAVAPPSNRRSCDVSGAHLLSALPDMDVGREPRVLAFDERGRVANRQPVAVHLWSTTMQRVMVASAP